MGDFVKHRPGAPAGFFACEAAGLRWLAEVADGVPCAAVRAVDGASLTLARLVPSRPTQAGAVEFGRKLAATHGAGATGWGAAPDGWGGPAFFGPLSHPLPMSTTVRASWGEFYAAERLVPMADLADRLTSDARRAVDRVVDACAAGEFDDDDAPARLHGDLWSGNVMWTAAGAVLIDPAAHGGHRETDLAMLALFGCPFLDDVVDGYQRVRPLTAGWERRRALHQLYPLLAHVVLFGAAYLGQTEAAAREAATCRDR